mgnify:FL=1
MRTWDQATYPDDRPDDRPAQVCAVCGVDCGPYDYDEAGREFVCQACDERRKARHFAEVFARR